MKVKITILDPDLVQLDAPELDYQLNQPYFSRIVYHFPIEGFIFGRYYIGITTAMDDHGADYRDHLPRSILAKNNRSLTEAPHVRFFNEFGKENGVERAVAGGYYVVAGTPMQRGGAAHIATFKALFTIANPTDPANPTVLNDQKVQFRFKTNVSGAPAQFVTATGGNPTTAPIELTTDAQGFATVSVLSSRKPGSAQISAWAEVAVPPRGKKRYLSRWWS